MRAFLVVLAACHVTVRTPLPSSTPSERVRIGTPIARPPTILLGDDATLRFVEPLDCATEQVVTARDALEIATRPNLATFAIGVIASAAGFALAIRGITDADPTGSPFTYGGMGLVTIGVPLAVGPWLGTRTELVAGAAGPPLRRAGPVERCGERPVDARAATLVATGIEVHGAVDRAGVFAVSPFQFVDAHALAGLRPLEIAARVEAAAGSRTIEATLDPNRLAAVAPAFLATIDHRIEPMRLVPGLTVDAIRVSLGGDAAGPFVRVTAVVRNAGPGPAWMVRAHLAAPAAPSIDGRVIYLGAIPKGTAVTRELRIPVTAAAAGALRASAVELALELHDAHHTAPVAPAPYRGPILVEPTP